MLKELVRCRVLNFRNTVYILKVYLKKKIKRAVIDNMGEVFLLLLHATGLTYPAWIFEALRHRHRIRRALWILKLVPV